MKRAPYREAAKCARYREAAKCARYREAASARLDGEPLGMASAALAEHLSTCTRCASWLAEASRIGRAVRVSGLTPPDLTEQILSAAVLPDRRVRRFRTVLRCALALLGLVQCSLSAPGFFGDQLDMHMSMHASHENAAWNLAIGAAFIATALRPARAAGAVPVLATFVAVLGVLSIPDVADGAVGIARLGSHAGVVLGLVLVLLMQRSQRLLPTGALAAVEVSGDDPIQVPRRSRGAA